MPEEAAATTWGLWWLGDFCGMLIFSPIAWIVARFWKGYRQKLKPGPIVPAVILNSTFAAVAVFAFMFLWNFETDKVSQSLARESSIAASSVTKLLQTAGRDMETFRAFLYASEHVSADEFRRYDLSEFGNRKDDPGAQAVEWVPRVTDPEEWETRMHGDIQDGVRLYEIDNSGKRIPVAQRDEYFPVQYIQPLTGANQGAIGFDLGSEKLLRAALERACDTDQLIMVTPIALVQLDTPAAAMLMAVPVYRPDVTLDTVAARRTNLTGFTVGVYLIGKLFDEALLAANADVDFYLFDEALPVGSQWYHTRASSSRADV